MSRLSSRLFRDSIRGAIASLGYRIETGPAASGSWRLKDRIVGGYADITILQTDRFEVELDSEKYFEAVRVGWRDGHTRFRKQLAAATAVAHMKQVPNAWVLVSSYYAAFFAAVELLQAAGVWIAFFDGDQISAVMSSAKSTPSGLSLSPGIYLGTARWDQSDSVHRIPFGRSPSGPHQCVWRQIGKLLLDKVAPSHSLELGEIDRFERFLGRGKNPWGTPSETRNEWNYQRVAFYGEAGEREGMTLRKIVKRDASAYGWASNRGLGRSDATEAAAVAFVMFVLADVVEHTGQVIL